MSSKFRAVDDIKKLSKYLSGLMEFSEELEKIGSIEQAGNEAQARANQMRIEADKAEEELLELGSQLSESRAKAESMVSDSKKQSELLVIEGRMKANALLEDAKSQASEIMAGTSADVASFKAEISALKSEKLELNREIEMKVSILKDLQSKLEEIKRKIG